MNDWQWLNEHRIVDAIKGLDPDTREDLLYGLDRILGAPFDPPGIDVHNLRAPRGRQDLMVAWLPHGWFLTYRPFLDGPFPHRGKHVVAVAMRHLDDGDAG